MHEQTIPCPNCNTDILFDVNALLQGVSFACGGCDAKIQLPAESKGLVQRSMEEFNKIKKEAVKQ